MGNIWRWSMIAAGAWCVLLGVVIWRYRPVLGPVTTVLGAILVVAGVLALRRRPRTDAGEEPDRMEDLDIERQRALLRGTSMHLRNMRYRYSIRFDHADRAPFTAEVNTITLGFVPVVILDNMSDKQGLGYVAFPHDGRRWRGPGLPCGGSPEQAVAHAARCVSPLEQTDDEPAD